MRKGKIILVGLMAFSFAMFLFGENGRAYFDPSVMNYVIQAAAGVAIAIGAACGLYFRKMKKKLSEKLNIEETPKKEVESDEIIVKRVGLDE